MEKPRFIGSQVIAILSLDNPKEWLSVDYGLPNRNRTCDPQLRRLMLYPAELWAANTC